MTQTGDLNLFFVLPVEDATEDSCSPDMKSAFDNILKYGSSAKWVNPSFCMEYKPTANDVFIFDQFEGSAFDKLKQNSSKILGSRCLLTCISDARSIPSGPSPVFTEGMRDLVICVTGFDLKTRKYIQEKVEYMGGIFDKVLRTATTHIITMNNLSVKAIKASSLNIPLMKKEWVDAVWNESVKHNVNGRDECFTKYVSPLFHNLRITTSGILKTEKERIKSLIQKHGGTFSGEMEDKQTHMVIISKPEGDKYKYALSWKIPCVKPEWLYACDKKGSILDYADFILESKPKSSTPNKDESNITANFSTISRIDTEGDKHLTHLNETEATPLSMTNTTCRNEFQKPKSVRKNIMKPTKVDPLTKVTLQEVKEAGQFLDGCNIFLYGFSTEQIEKLKKILNLGGATRFDEYSDSVTHIIVGNAQLNDLHQFKNALVVSVDWLIESIKMQKQATENLFLCVRQVVASTEPPSPLSKQAAQLFSKNESKTVASKLSFDEEGDKNEPVPLEEDLVQKYNKSQSVADGFKELEKFNDRTHQLASQRSNNASMTSENDSTTNISYFKDIKFFISDELTAEERENMEEVIVDGGGQVVNKRYPGVPDYAIVPLHGTLLNDITTKEVVNMLFIVDCCLAKGIVPLQYYHQPVAFVKNSRPLEGCVISVSNYVQRERDFMEQLITTLGAVSQSSLARKPKDNVLKSTHLVCAEPNGPKYEGALRWGLPIVHHDWLLKCASLGIKVSEQPYLVGDSKLSKSITSSQSTKSFVEPAKVTTNNVFNVQNSFATPEGSKLTQRSKQVTPVLKNPPINNVVARLRQETPNRGDSPDPNRTMTPTSPYGAFYGTDNPSPNTRKRLLRWMNQGADFPLDPPMKVVDERKDTPISEMLSRQLLLMKRKPEDIPPDDSPLPRKRLNMSGNENEEKSEQNDAILNALQKMKEIEENYKKNQSKTPTPVRKSNEYVSTGQPQMLIIAESQPHTEVGWEDPNEKEIALDKLEKSAESQITLKIFMLSGFTDNFNEVQQLIEDSGGKISSLTYFDKNATHLIATSLNRAEKVMGSISAGIWILHPSYLEELKTVKSVYAVSEEEYEWGNPSKTLRLESLSNHSRECAQSSYFWRHQRLKNEPPVFKDMKILLHIQDSRYDSFRRILEVGGAIIIKADPPYDCKVDATLCIYDVNCKEKINFMSLANQNIKCVSHIFICDRILRKNNPVEQYLVNEYPVCKTEK